MAYCQDSFGLSSVVAPDNTNILLEGNGLFYFKKTEQIQIINLITKEVVVSFDQSNEIYSLLETKLKKPDIMKELKPNNFPLNQLVLMSNNQILKVGDQEDSVFIDLLKATQIAKLPGVVIKQTTREMYLLHDRNLFVYPYCDRQIDSCSKKYVLDLGYRLERHQIKLCDSDQFQFYAKRGLDWQFYTLEFDNQEVNINQCLSQSKDKKQAVVLNKNLCYKYEFLNTKQLNGLDQIEIEEGDNLLFSNNKKLKISAVLNTFVISDKPNILIFYLDKKRQTHYCIIECQKDRNKKTNIWEPSRTIQNYFVGEDYIIYKSAQSNEVIVQSLFNLQDKHSFLFKECFIKIGKRLTQNAYEPLVLIKENEQFQFFKGFQLEQVANSFVIGKNEEFEFHAGQITDFIVLNENLLIQLDSNLVLIENLFFSNKKITKLVSKNKFPQQKLVLSNQVIYYFEIDQTNSYIKQLSAGKNTFNNKKYCDLPGKQILSIELGLKDELFVLTHNFKVIVIENGVVIKNISDPHGMINSKSVLVLSHNNLLDFDTLMNLSNNNKHQLALPKGNQEIIFVENIFQKHLFVTSNETEGSFILQQNCCSRNIGLHSRFKFDNETIQIFSTESCLIKYKEIDKSKTIYFYDKNSFRLIGSSKLPETTTKVQVIDQLLLREDSEITKNFEAKENIVTNGWSCIKIYKNQQSLEFDFCPEFDQLFKDAFDFQQNSQQSFSFPSFLFRDNQLFCFMKTKMEQTIVKIKNLNIYLLKDDYYEQFLITEKFIALKRFGEVQYTSLIDIPEIDTLEDSKTQKETIQQILLYLSDLRISRANESDVKLIQKWNKPKQNVLSIQDGEVCILWDLESNTEISCISDHIQLQEPCNYVDTGFNTLRDQQYLIQNEVFQTYSIANLLELINTKRKVHTLKSTDLDEETIFAIYGNQNFFNMIWDFSQLYNKNNQRIFEDRLILVFDWLKQTIQDQNILNKQQTNKMDNIFVRRLFYLLNNTIMPFESQELIRFDIKEGRPNLLQWAILQRSNILEPLLNLLAYSSEFKFDDVVGSYFLFEEIDQIKSSTLQKLIQTNLTVRNPNRPTKILVSWNDQFNLITMPMIHSQALKLEIQEQLTLQQQKQRTFREKCQNKIMRSLNVDIRIIDITWLQNEKYSKFFKYLVKGQKPDGKLYFQRNIVQYLVDYESRNILFQLLPILTTNFIFTVLNLIYLNIYIFTQEISNQATCLGSFIIFTATLMCFVECYQIYKQRLDYINFWNIVQLSVYILSITVVIQHLLSRWDQATLFQVASVTSFLLWLTVFYWLRVLPQFSYYVKMISQAVDDIKYFLLMLLIIIIAFSNANFILLQIGSEQNDLSPLYLSTLLRQYNIAFTIGDIFTPNDENDTLTSILMDILSVASTLVTTTVFLNIFIGIIGTTLKKVSEINRFVTLREQVQLYHDYEQIIRLYSKTNWLQGKKYLYILTPSIDKDQLDNTSEKVQAILESCNFQEQILNEMKMERNEIKKTINENQKQMSDSLVEIHKKIDSLIK